MTVTDELVARKVSGNQPNEGGEWPDPYFLGKFNQRQWLWESYLRPGLSSEDRRKTVQQLMEMTNQLELLILQHELATCEDSREHARLWRQYQRKRLTLRPPKRYWLRYLLFVASSVAATLGVQYALSLASFG